MVKAETREFVEENRGLLQEVASRKESPLAPLAAAFLTVVTSEENRESSNSKREEESATRSDTSSPTTFEKYSEGSNDDVAEK